MSEIIGTGDKKNANRFVKEVVLHLRKLAAETDTVKRSEFFQHYLETMSKFWKYSYHSQLLIMSQMPQATRIAGFRRWREMRRYVIRYLRRVLRRLVILIPIRHSTEFWRGGLGFLSSHFFHRDSVFGGETSV